MTVDTTVTMAVQVLGKLKGTVTVAKREAGTWWFALAQFGGLTLLGFATATLIYQAGLLL